MTPNESVKVFSTSPSQLPPGGSGRDKQWSRKVVVVVLTVMKPGRFSCKSVLKAVIATVVLTVVTGFVLLSLTAPLHTSLTPESVVSPHHVSGRRRLRLTHKDGRFDSERIAHSASDDSSGFGNIWDIQTYKSKRDIRPECEEKAVLLMLITSSPSNMDRRDAIRKSWCSTHAMGFSVKKWQCVFMLGQTDNHTIGAHIRHESLIYGDILQGSYLDVYRNLTLKVFHGFDWAANNCHQIQYVLKTDDDCFVNAGLMHNFLVTHNKIVINLYVGNVFAAEDKRSVIRYPKSRWFVSSKDFYDDTYPRYASGTGYLMSYDVLQRIIKISKSVRPFPVEDAYVGCLMHKLGIEPITTSRFTLYGTGWTTCNFLYLMVVHNVEPKTQKIMLAKTLNASYSKCQFDEAETSWR